MHDIPEIFTFLFDQYGQIGYEHLRQEENKIENFEYSMTDPPIVIFNAMEDLVRLSTAAKRPKSQQQIIMYGLNIFKRTGEFDTSLTTWYNLAPTDSTWHNIEKHFTITYNNILKIIGKIIKNIPYLQANKAISQFTEEFAHMHYEVLNNVNALTQVHYIFELQDLPQEPSLTSANAHSVTQSQAINSTIQNDINEL